MLMNLDYTKVRKMLIDRISAFFENYQKQKEKIEQSVVLNKIFKKILLELNKSNIDSVVVNSQILILTDVNAQYEVVYDQKLVFLLKKMKIIIDCLHICDNINYYIQGISTYTGGLYEIINSTKLMQQKLLQCFLTFSQERKSMKSPLICFENKKFICGHCFKDITEIELFEKNVFCGKCKKELITEKDNFCQIKNK